MGLLPPSPRMSTFVPPASMGTAVHPLCRTRLSEGSSKLNVWRTRKRVPRFAALKPGNGGAGRNLSSRPSPRRVRDGLICRLRRGEREREDVRGAGEWTNQPMTSDEASYETGAANRERNDTTFAGWKSTGGGRRDRGGEGSKRRRGGRRSKRGSRNKVGKEG